MGILIYIEMVLCDSASMPVQADVSLLFSFSDA